MTAEDRLTTPPHLNGQHRHPHETIFRHPAAHNLECHDVRSPHLGDVVEGNATLQVTWPGTPSAQS